jgi:hypothetical protein
MRSNSTMARHAPRLHSTISTRDAMCARLTRIRRRSELVDHRGLQVRFIHHEIDQRLRKKNTPEHTNNNAEE